MAADGASPHVLIIGAGMSGLTLAQQLKKNNIAFTIFERDIEADARNQGWALSLFGQALHQLENEMPPELGPIDEANHLLPLQLPAQFCFYDITQPDLRVGIISDESGKLLRVNRQKLRSWLMQGLEVQYSKRLVRVEERNDDHGGGTVTAHFADGTTATGDFLVGAEGTRSVVRKHLLGGRDVMTPLPVGSLVGEVALSGEEFAQQLSLAHSGYIIMNPTLGSDEQSSVFAALNRVSEDGQTGYYYYLLLWVDQQTPFTDDEHPTWYAKASQQELATFAQDKTKSYPPHLRTLVQKVPVEGYKSGGFQLQGVKLEPDQLPAGRSIIIGDAAHSMTPFRGEAGACAFKDAFSLGQTFVNIRDTRATGAALSMLLVEFRDGMLARGKWAIEISNTVLEDYGKEADYEFATFGKTAVPMPMKPVIIG